MHSSGLRPHHLQALALPLALALGDAAAAPAKLAPNVLVLHDAGMAHAGKPKVPAATQGGGLELEDCTARLPLRLGWGGDVWSVPVPAMPDGPRGSASGQSHFHCGGGVWSVAVPVMPDGPRGSASGQEPLPVRWWCVVHLCGPFQSLQCPMAPEAPPPSRATSSCVLPCHPLACATVSPARLRHTAAVAARGPRG